MRVPPPLRRWLRILALATPLTCEVDARRTLMLPGGRSAFGLGLDAGALLVGVAGRLAIAARLYPRMVT